jgi:hypothetical protein
MFHERATINHGKSNGAKKYLAGAACDAFFPLFDGVSRSRLPQTIFYD